MPNATTSARQGWDTRRGSTPTQGGNTSREQPAAAISPPASSRGDTTQTARRQSEGVKHASPAPCEPQCMAQTGGRGGEGWD